jgi:Ca-activated chloride channel family protein
MTIGGRHYSAASRRRWGGGWVAVGLAIGVTLTAGIVIVNSARNAPAEQVTSTPTVLPTTTSFAEDTMPAAAGAAPCTTVRVLASFENRPMLDALNAGYHGDQRSVGGHCVLVEVAVAQTGLAATDVTAGFPQAAADARPAIWAPDSSAWLSLATAKAGAEGRQSVVPAAATGITTTPIVLAMPAPQADASGWLQEPPTWAEYVQAAGAAGFWAGRGQPQWGAFQIGRTSPLTATSGLMGLLAEFGALAGHVDDLPADAIADAGLRDQVRKAELSIVHYMASQEHFFWHIRQAGDAGDAHGFVSAVTADEKAVWDFNRGIVSRDGVTRDQQPPPKVPIVPIYPRDGTFFVDSPLAVLNASWVDATTRAAAEDFVRFAHTVQGQAVVRASGYRDLAGKADTEVATVGKYGDVGLLKALRVPSAQVLAAIQDSFLDVRKRARVLFAVDLSNSMRQTVADGRTRLAAAQSAILAALDHFVGEDQVGLAGFSNSAADPAVAPGVIVPVGALNAQRDALVDAVNHLEPNAQTPLYAAVSAFGETMAGDGYDPSKINALVLLSDGRNDTIDTTTDAQMAERLTAIGHQKPVLIFTLAFAEDADKPTLQLISKLTRAHYYDASDPLKVTKVLGDLVTSF